VLDGFLARAQAVEALLRQPGSSFLLVMAPELPSVNEALYFSGRLRAAGLPLSGFVANRVAPVPGTTQPDELRAKLADVPGLASLDLVSATEQLAQVAAYLRDVARDQARQLERLAHDAPDVPVTRVPLLTHDVSSLASLRTVGDHLSATP
jgi:anion-transporting  ArsA/GET3 family ATPase